LQLEMLFDDLPKNGRRLYGHTVLQREGHVSGDCNGFVRICLWEGTPRRGRRAGMRGSSCAETATKGGTDRTRAHGVRRLAADEPAAAAADREAGEEVRAAARGTGPAVGAGGEGLAPETLDCTPFGAPTGFAGRRCRLLQRIADDPVLLSKVGGRV